jgi:hypothetical protein
VEALESHNEVNAVMDLVLFEDAIRHMWVHLFPAPPPHPHGSFSFPGSGLSFRYSKSLFLKLIN